MVWVLVWGTAPPGPPTHPKGLCLRRQPEVREQVGPGPEPLEAGSPQPSTAPSAGEEASSLWTVCLGLLPAFVDLPSHSTGTSAGQLLSFLLSTVPGQQPQLHTPPTYARPQVGACFPPPIAAHVPPPPHSPPAPGPAGLGHLCLFPYGLHPSSHACIQSTRIHCVKRLREVGPWVSG